MATVRAFRNKEPNVNPPVLAILTVDNNKRSFLGNRANFIDIINKGRSMGFIVYVLTVKNLILGRSHLKGFIFNEENNKWQRENLPFPNVIYNRIPQREHEKEPAVRAKLKACRDYPNLFLFNPYYFNKWRLYKWLNKSEKTMSLVPNTRRLISIEVLDRMLQKHANLYLKPVSGKAGNGIMTVAYRTEKTLPYRLKIQLNKKSSTYYCSTMRKLWLKIQNQRNREAYIVQQAIKLASYQDRSYDLRALVQKNKYGKWELSGLGARLAGARSITTHVPRGGQIEEPEKLLRYSFDDEHSVNILADVKSTALRVARQIERGSGRKLGEMSMDLGVDIEGNIWIFEANAKPMKFDEPQIRQKSLERIFQYSHYLMNKKSKEVAEASVSRNKTY